MHHYLKTALRNQSKNKIFSIINVLGLSIGIAIAVLIINYVNFEFSYDNIHTDSERIYRVESQFYEGDILTDDWATSSFGYGSAMKKEITGIEDYVRIGVHNTEQTVAYKTNRNLETGIAYAEASFFSIFNFKIIKGDKQNQLVRPGTCVITEDMAARYFKGENPIGKILTFASRSQFNDYEVTAVMENFPHNSHIKYNILISYESLPDWQRDFWYIHEVYTYVKLSQGIRSEFIEDKFPIMAEKYKTRNALKNKKWAVSLVPLKSIHFNPQKQYEREVKKDKKSLSTLIIIAIVILLIAWTNYINLSTARSMERAKDIGIRKVSGAFKSQLTFQYLMESVLVNLSSFLLATLLIIIFNPLFKQLINQDIELNIIYSTVFWLISIGSLLLGTLISGFYSSFILTRLEPSAILKGNFYNIGSSATIRRVLVIFQFASAIFLICGTFIVYKQVKFMQTTDIGVDINKTLVIKYPVIRKNINKQVQLFANKIENEPSISSV